MWRLVSAGLLYLTGIAIILVLKPTIMFQEDGRWKEFGIGRDPTYFTFIPFWLFTIIWSVFAYLIVMLIEEAIYSNRQRQQVPPPTISEPIAQPNRNNGRGRNSKRANAVNSKELAPGYYMLNQGATGRNGVPRYVYLGPEGVDGVGEGEGDE